MSAYGPLCTEFYDNDKPFAPADAVEFYVQRALAAGGPVLEPMCGSGRFLLPLLRSGIEAEGVDDASAMLEACRRHAAKQQLSPVLYKQSVEALSLPRRYRMAFVPSGSIGLLERDSLQNALSSVLHHLEPGAPLLLELLIAVFDGGVDGEGSLDHRVVPVDEETRIVYSCTARLSGEQDSIHYMGRYEKWRNAELLAVEEETLVLWKREPAAFLQVLHDCGYVQAHIVEGEPYASLRASGSLLVEAYAEA
jgi:SAM-dependent methyltransferase